MPSVKLREEARAEVVDDEKGDEALAQEVLGTPVGQSLKPEVRRWLQQMIENNLGMLEVDENLVLGNLAKDPGDRWTPEEMAEQLGTDVEGLQDFVRSGIAKMCPFLQMPRWP